jgi:YfiH family protein
MIFEPDWQLPNNIKALFTDRSGGISQKPFDSFNLAMHVGDNPEDVEINRQQLAQTAGLPNSPYWLDQQHTDRAIELLPNRSGLQIADASWTKTPGLVASVMTADCLPILVAAKDGSAVAAIHAGWKGLAKGIISNTIEQMQIPAEQLTVWIGPAISAAHFEVGQDVYQEFTSLCSVNQSFFQPHPQRPEKYLCDLAAIAGFELQSIGVEAIQLSRLCSYADKNRFYSYRRDGKTGRMVSLIWITE